MCCDVNVHFEQSCVLKTVLHIVSCTAKVCIILAARKYSHISFLPPAFIASATPNQLDFVLNSFKIRKLKLLFY